MSKEWLSAQNFERLHGLISAINTISINAKLETEGIDDSARKTEVEQACTLLLKFLDEFEALVDEVERDKDNIAIGSDPRLGSLAKKFMSLKTQRPRTSSLASLSLGELKELLQSQSLPNRMALIQYLRDLRRLLEQHAHDDVIKVLGEL